VKFSSIRKVSVIAGSVFLLAVGLPFLGTVSGEPPAAATSVPSCRGNDFLGAWVGKNGATGTSIFQVAFINNGPAACRLAGYPTIQGYRNGRQYPLKAEDIEGQEFQLSPTIVARRMSGEMFITTSALCNPLNTGGQSTIKKEIARTTYSVSVKFPHSDYPVDVYGLHLTIACSLDITQLGWR
jgi:hypothetical protein